MLNRTASCSWTKSTRCARGRARAASGAATCPREGVQRDLLPLIEGTTVSTKYGPVKTDHILFIASGAFHLAKPSDLLPELQGRLPIRVELAPLSRADLRADSGRAGAQPAEAICGADADGRRDAGVPRGRRGTRWRIWRPTSMTGWRISAPDGWRRCWRSCWRRSASRPATAMGRRWRWMPPTSRRRSRRWRHGGI